MNTSLVQRMPVNLDFRDFNVFETIEINQKNHVLRNRKVMSGFTFPPLVPKIYNVVMGKLCDCLLEYYINKFYDENSSSRTSIKENIPPDERYSEITKFSLHDRNIKCRSKEGRKFVGITLNEHFRVMKHKNLLEFKEFIFKFKYENKEEIEIYFSKYLGEEKLSPIVSLLNGNETELSVSHNLPCKSDAEWTNWKAESPLALKTYEERVYPLLEKLFERVHLVLNRTLTVLDVAGGDGQLAENIFIKNKESIKEYHLVDNNDKEITEATSKKCLNSELNKKFFVHKADVVKANYSELLSKKADVMILSGVVADSVLTSEQSIIVLKNCKNAIEDDGVILISSFTDPIFLVEQAEELGLRAWNRLMPRFKLQKNGKQLKESSEIDLKYSTPLYVMTRAPKQ